MLLIYIVFVFSGPSWAEAIEVYSTSDQSRCEAVAAQLSTTGKRYSCEPMVQP